jgi:hypothetical protein
VWDVDDVEQELRQRFGSGTTAIDIGDFELELVQDSEIWIDGDSHDIIMRAIGRLNRENQYVIVRGNEILDKPQSDATLRDVGSATTVGASYLAERIEEAIDEDGYANLDTIIGEIRSDESVFLPPDETKTVAREAVNDFLVDDYVLEAGGRYLESLGDRDPRTVKIVPTVPDRIGEQILEYIEELVPGEIQVVVELLEPTIVAVRTRDVGVRVDGTGGVASSLELLGERGLAFFEVPVPTVIERVATGEHRRHRRGGGDALRDTVVEPDSLVRETVERRGIRVPVAEDGVVAEGIDDEEEDVRRRGVRHGSITRWLSPY